jgi:hypothetical protein
MKWIALLCALIECPAWGQIHMYRVPPAAFRHLRHSQVQHNGIGYNVTIYDTLAINPNGEMDTVRVTLFPYFSKAVVRNDTTWSNPHTWNAERISRYLETEQPVTQPAPSWWQRMEDAWQRFWHYRLW